MIMYKKEVLPLIFNSWDERFNCHMSNSVEKIDLNKNLSPGISWLKGMEKKGYGDSCTVSGYLWEKLIKLTIKLKF